MTSFTRLAVAGLAALASTLSITMSTAELVHAAEPLAAQRIAHAPGGEMPAPPLPTDDDSSPRTSPSTAPDENSANAGSCRTISDGKRECTRIWWPPDPGEGSTDSATLAYQNSGRWHIYAACDFNGDGTSIGIQIDPSDGKSDYYTRRPPTSSCSGEIEARTIHRFRFVAVNRSGTAVGTPTAWETPPWGAGPP
jgi:hypothetical protein